MVPRGRFSWYYNEFSREAFFGLTVEYNKITVPREPSPGTDKKGVFGYEGLPR